MKNKKYTHKVLVVDSDYYTAVFQYVNLDTGEIKNVEQKVDVKIKNKNQ